ncbi:MAG: LysM peptidoglycan-binding domain-containing protein [Firmicutes bacterium]|nr:LysM peptidoglycan-binding domain-containing protein [Bacillota bacterium]
MFKKYKIVSPVRFFIFVLLTTMILVFGLVTVFTSARTEAATINSFVQVEINENDTLWTIATEYADDSMDIRKFIDELREINDIDANDSIHPGDQIFIPIYE